MDCDEIASSPLPEKTYPFGRHEKNILSDGTKIKILSGETKIKILSDGTKKNMPHIGENRSGAFSVL
jgi:hypothetical protein